MKIGRHSVGKRPKCARPATDPVQVAAMCVCAAAVHGRHHAQRAHLPLSEPPLLHPAVLDIVARVDHSLLERLGMEPGGCVPVSAEEMGRLLALPEVHGGMKR